MKKVMLVVLVLLLSSTLLLAGGAQEEKESDQPAKATAGEKSPIQIYNPGFAFPSEKIKLSFWHILGTRTGYNEWATKIIEDYSKIHPNVSIDIRDVPAQEYKTIFLAAIETGTMPDVYNNALFIIHSWGEAMPAPDWAVKIFEEKYTDAANGYQQYNGPRKEWQGKYMGWFAGEIDPSQMLYYNKTMLREAGVDLPKTLPELVNAMKKSTKYDASGTITQGGWGIRYAGGTAGISDKWKPFLFCFRDSEKGWLFSEDWNDVADWEGDDFVAAATLFQDMVWNWKVASTDMPVPYEAFKLGMVAMTNRESFLSGILENEVPDLEYGIAPLVVGSSPYGSEKPGVSLYVSLNFVSKDTKYSDIAWDFNMFMNTDERDLELSKLTGSYPRRKANVDSEYARNIIWLDTYKEMYSRPLQRDERLDPYGVYDQVATIIGEALDRVIQIENTDVRQALRESKMKAQEALDAAKAKK